MNVDISFSFAKVYNIDKRVEIALGQKFSFISDFPNTLNWFNDSDPVLSINVVNSNNVDAETTKLGSSTILIMDSGFQILKELTIKVVESIEQATDLGVVAEAPELK